MIDGWHSRGLEERGENPLFLLKSDEVAPELFRHDIHYSNGFIHFFGELVSSDGGDRVSNLRFQTNITGAERAFIDATVELCQRKNAQELSEITIFDVAEALHCTSITPSFNNTNSSIHRLFSFTQKLKEILLTDVDDMSPDCSKRFEFVDYEQNSGLSFDHGVEGPFSTLALDRQFVIVESILDIYIRKSLQADGGDIECSHIAEDLIVIKYLGRCGSCGQSLTSTMDMITKILRSELNSTTLTILADS
jgi:Fe-S cluster biogenesis protein NfuA